MAPEIPFRAEIKLKGEEAEKQAAAIVKVLGCWSEEEDPDLSWDDVHRWHGKYPEIEEGGDSHWLGYGILYISAALGGGQVPDKSVVPGAIGVGRSFIRGVKAHGDTLALYFTAPSLVDNSFQALEDVHGCAISVCLAG